ncbi:MAG: hypothetical protein AAF532_13935 [Planctomycetota bacterium]
MGTNRTHGYSESRTVEPREILHAMTAVEGMFLPGGIVVDDTAADGGNTDYTHEIREGWLMGQINASKKCVPLKRTRLDAAAAGATEITVDDASAFAVGDTITVGSATGQTISAINYATGVITLAAAVAQAEDAAVHAEDGSETFIGILGQFVDLNDEDANKIDFVGASLYVKGQFKYGKLLGDVDALIAHAQANYAVHALSDVQIWDGNVRKF